MRTISLGGKVAAGRVARVDDDDFELVNQHAWHVRETPATATRRAAGPYAATNLAASADGRHTITMHALIMGRRYIDHIDHDTLNNQRYNLRPATHSQNGANQRPQEGRSSQFKGVYWDNRRRGWGAAIKLNGRFRYLGITSSELEAAYAYDAAAREMFGEFALPNCPVGPTDAMRAEWASAREERRIAGALNHAASHTNAAYWAQKEPDLRTCIECGNDYLSKSTRSSCCSKKCTWNNWYKRKKEREQEGRLF